ncbi:MAG: hypothetical protein ACTSRS_17910 [Candidatus Helarchaeota archaeon]
MSNEEDQFWQFNQPINQSRRSTETYDPDLSRRGFYAPQYGAGAIEFETGKEPLKGRKIVGGILSITVGVIALLSNITIAFSHILPSEILSFFLLIAINAPIVVIVGGGIGMGRAVRIGAILTLIGNSIMCLLDISILISNIEGTPLLLFLLIVNIIGIFSSFILFASTRKAFYLD